MSRSLLIKGLVAAVVLQLFILAGMLVKAEYPLWVGSEIRVKTVPVDPRSMFRGNYARLSYPISRLPKGSIAPSMRLRKGEVVYVQLHQADGDEFYSVKQALLEPPADGLFLRGRIVNNYAPYRVKYGIEAFFAPKVKALKLEKELRNGGVALLMVTDGGRVALKDVVPNEEESSPP